jgi:uncharacterized protein (DUF1800 family)
MKYAKILTYKYKNTEWALDGDDYEGLVWLSDTTKPTKAELDAQWDEVQAIIKAEAEAKAEAKAVAQAKLAALGLTVSDLEALGL